MANPNPKRNEEERTKIISIILLGCLLLAVPSLVLAQQAYLQPMYEIHWKTHTLLIQIPDAPPQQRATPEQVKGVMLLAISRWNEAQDWFIQTYYPTHPEAKFTLQEVGPNEKPQITIQYVKSLSCPSAQYGCVGLTSNYGTQISMILSGPWGLSLTLVMHELGHSLGLADNSIANDGNMYADMEAYLGPSALPDDYDPSTLDLYGVFLQAQCQCYGQGDSVSLTHQIPYMVWKPPVVPEFPNPLPLLLVAVASASLILGINRRRVPLCNSQKHVPRV
ncbi:MAG: hypothetical protein ACHQ03_10060 [Candidatus Bathyarchaeia archaeon]